jgi:high-affinity iron transporter
VAGVACAAALSLAFGAVLTFAAADLSTTSQEAIGGVLSLVAVGLVTWMVFWMRRTARTLSADLRTRTEAALAVGGALLFATAFLAVAREGLEAALFLWSTTRTAGESTGPLLGALVGLLIAVGLCWALYRRSLRINLTRFFTWTGVALIVIAAGVVGYGLRDLQEAGVLPGLTRTAFDISAHVNPASWFSRTIEGVFNITPAMTRFQVAGYLLYLAPVLTAFVVMTRRAAASAAASADSIGASPVPLPEPGRSRRPWLLMGALGGALTAATVGVIVAVGRLQPDPASRPQLRPRRGQQRQPRHGSRLQLLPAGHPAAIRSDPDSADRRAVGRLHQPDGRRLFLCPPRRDRRQRSVRPGAIRLTAP